MTEYFDAANRDISERVRAHQGDSNAQLAVIEMVEARVIEDVNAIIEDREFPEELREKARAYLAQAIKNVSGEGRKYARTMKCSMMIDRLHSLFHELARRRLEVRWGVLSDDPGGMVRAREKHDRRPGTGDGYTL